MTDRSPPEFRFNAFGYGQRIGRAIRLLQILLLVVGILLVIAVLLIVIPEGTPGGFSLPGSSAETHAHWPLLTLVLLYVLELFVD